MSHRVLSLVLSLVLPLGAAKAADITLPAGLNPGDEYRIAFVTSTARNATSGNITDYNEFVTMAATADGTLTSRLDTTWTAIVSTIGGDEDDPIDARDNTMTNPEMHGPGVPIYLPNGLTRIAENYEDLWDGSIAAALRMNEDGDVSRLVGVWTGTTSDGTEFHGLGAETAMIGHEEVDNHYSWIGFCCIFPEDDQLVDTVDNRLIYGLSAVVTVVPEPSTLIHGLVGLGLIGYGRKRIGWLKR